MDKDHTLSALDIAIGTTILVLLLAGIGMVRGGTGLPNMPLDSPGPIILTIESSPKMVTMHLESATSAASARMILGGFIPNTTYHKYEDDYHNHTVFTTDANGKYTYIQDLSKKHFVFIQSRPSTKFINDNATGGDCTTFGTWNSVTKTCTMIIDLTETIQIDSDGIILNGNGHKITGSNTGIGVYLSYRTGVTIKNLNVKQFSYGIYLGNSHDNKIINNIASNNLNYGIALSTSYKNNLTNNTASNNSEGINFGYYPSNENNLTGNTAKNNIRIGIYIRGHNNNLLSNKISNNSEGIHLYYAGHNNLTNNTLSYNGQYGIFSDWGAIYNNFTGNTISNNPGYGILIRYGNNNYVTENIVSNNSVGIVIAQEQVYIFNNYFNNTENSRLYNSYNNSWNITRQLCTNIVEGPFLGGNFWGNHSGTGFSQTCADANKDGICDSTYPLDAYNADYLPLAVYSVPPGYGYISGAVLNETGIEDAIVITNTNNITTTDASGIYSLLVPAGTYNLTATKEPEYDSNTVIVTAISGTTVTQDIELLKKPTGNITGSVTS